MTIITIAASADLPTFDIQFPKCTYLSISTYTEALLRNPTVLN